MDFITIVSVRLWAQVHISDYVLILGGQKTITCFLIINDKWQLLNGLNLSPFKFNLMDPSKSI